MNIRLLISLVVLLFVALSITAQNGQSISEFIEKGEVHIRIYSNMHSGLNESDRSSAFEINRAYFGFKSYLSKNFSAEIKLDIGSPEDESQYSKLRRYAYFKYAYLKYKKNNFSLKFGLIGLKQFSLQEKFWSRRYIYKTIQDYGKMGASADIGMMAEYRFNQSVSLDLAIMNGEGYSSLQNDNTYKSAAGLTIKPLKSLTSRIYWDYTQKSVIQHTTSVFVGYKLNKKLTLAGEYNTKFNNDFDEDYNYEGYSIYASYAFLSNFEAFARYDKLYSNIPDGETVEWNLTKDGELGIYGIQYQPVKKVKMALNIQQFFPASKDIDKTSFVFLNLEYDF